MDLSQDEILDILRDRGNEPPLLDAGTLVSGCLDTERDRRVLEQLGLGRGDLLKHYGGADASVVIRRRRDGCDGNPPSDLQRK